MKSDQVLLASIRSAPYGLSVGELLERHPDVARRSAQRWLSRWVDEGKLVTEGEGRGRRYFPSPTPPLSVREPTDTRPTDIPLSADSEEVLAYISQPVTARRPVGYQRDFLDAYEPNRTHYLPAPLRKQLHRIGDTGQSRLPAGTYGRAILNRLLIDLSWASSHLEGNTYSRLDTRELIEHGRAASGKASLETQMILNHKAAIELLVENADHVGFDRFTVLNLHSALAENLMPNAIDEGRVRQHAVDIGQSVYRPVDVPMLLEELLDDVLNKAQRIVDPFEQSFFVMVHLPYLQPFADVNKRTSRLATNLPLIRANLCPLTFIDVPTDVYSRAILGVYEMTRVELLRDLYVWAYERSTQEYLAIRQHLVEPDPLRLTWREVIRQTVGDVVRQPDRDALTVIDEHLASVDLQDAQDDVRAQIIEELRRLHEGVLARYRLRPSDLARWKAARSGFAG